MIGRRDFFFFVPILLLSILTPLFLPYLLRLFFYFVSFLLFNFFLFFILLKGVKHSCMSSTFPIAILNGTCFFRNAKWSFLPEASPFKIKLLSTKQSHTYIISGLRIPTVLPCERNHWYSRKSNVQCDNVL